MPRAKGNLALERRPASPGGLGEPGEARTLLKNRAHDRLKDLIVTGAYPPGTFLSERQLATTLGMSKTPVRAALERLEAEGFVVVSPQQGIVVREPSVREIADLFDIRVGLETLVVRRLAGRVSAGQAERLRANLAAQAEAVEAGDLARSTHLDADFHLLLSEFFDNREVTRVMERLRDKLDQIAYRVSSRSVGRAAASYREHAAIAAALLDGDGELAAARVEAHLEYGKRTLVGG